jgi:hypothetical protein
MAADAELRRLIREGFEQHIPSSAQARALASVLLEAAAELDR